MSDQDYKSSPQPSPQSSSQSGALIRNISDTARWAAVYRARETERPDAIFRDPFARRLAGERGEEIARTLDRGRDRTWPWVARTYLFDEFITREIAGGADLVVNLAAGLDARPYRLDLPASLPWIEVDLPEILAYKEELLGDAQPRCALERVRLDLADADARRELFGRLGARGHKALVITEGFLTYLAPEEVAILARDLAAPASFQRWILDIGSPGLLRMLTKEVGSHLSQAGAPFKFGPKEGPGFFTPYGWRPAAVRSYLQTAARLKRLPLFLRLMAVLPESSGAQGSRPWAAACLLEKE